MRNVIRSLNGTYLFIKIHKVTLKLESTFAEINKMLSEHLSKNKSKKSTSINKNNNNNIESESAVNQNKIKKPAGAFFLFCKEKRSVLKKNF